SRDPGGDGPRRGLQGVGLDHLRHEPIALGIGRADVSPRRDQIERTTCSDELREQVADRRIRSAEASSDERRAEARGGRSDSYVARAGEREPTAVRGSVHRGDHDLGKLAESDHHVRKELLPANPDLGMAVLARFGWYTPAAQIKPRAEGAPGPGQDRDAAVSVRGDLVERVMQVADK